MESLEHVLVAKLEELLLILAEPALSMDELDDVFVIVVIGFGRVTDDIVNVLVDFVSPNTS